MRTFQNWEYGLFIPKWDQLVTLAGVLGCAVPDLFAPLDDEPEPNGEPKVAA